MRSPLFFFALISFGFSTLAKAQDNAQLQIGGATIDVSLDPAPPSNLRKLVLDWISTAARAVTTYYAKFPVPHLAIAVNFDDREGVHSGRAFGWEHAHISISVGRSTTGADFADDWTITHEMVHLAFPSVAESHHWIEEGLATYVEPVARARAGDLLPQKVWGDMFDAMAQGLPKSRGSRTRFHAHLGQDVLGRRLVLSAGRHRNPQTHQKPARTRGRNAWYPEIRRQH